MTPPTISTSDSADGTVQRNRNRKRRNRRRKQKAPRGGTGRSTSTAPAPQPAPEASQGWMPWLGGVVTSGLSSLVSPASADSGDTMVPGYGEKVEDSLGTFEDADDEPIDAETLLGVPEVALTLRSGELKREISGTEVDGAYELKAALDGFEGTGKLQITNGQSSTVTSDEVRIAGSLLTGTFTGESFIGAKAGTKGKLQASASSVALRAEANAFIGQEYMGSTRMTVNVDGNTIATFEGGAGLTVGVGGEVKGHFSYGDGKLRFGTKGALSAGTGVAWEYKLDLDSAAVASGLWGWAGSWASWLWEHAGDLGDALLDEDGEPIRIF